jgi:hypothetical protein
MDRINGWVWCDRTLKKWRINDRYDTHGFTFSLANSFVEEYLAVEFSPSMFSRGTCVRNFEKFHLSAMEKGLDCNPAKKSLSRHRA